MTKLKKDYEERYNEPLSTFAGFAHDSLMLVVEACRNGANTPAEIRDAIENTTGFIGATGEFNYSASDHTGLTKDSLEMLTVKDGQFRILER